MTYTSIQAAVAAEHVRDLQREVELTRLARLARCCHPAAWRHAAKALAGRITDRRVRSTTSGACAIC